MKAIYRTSLLPLEGELEGVSSLLACLVCCIAATLTSCSNDTDNVFDQSASERTANAQALYYDILEGQQQGWTIDYYPSDGSMGGIAYTVRFSGGEATVACEQAVRNPVTNTTYPVGTELTSLYRITNETGVILSFDTYNPLMHYWSQPSQGHGKGYESDYEFTFISASADSVVLRGKKYGNLLRMYPLHEAATDYVGKVAQMSSTLSAVTRKRAVVNGVDVAVTMADNLLTFPSTQPRNSVGEFGSPPIKTVPFVYTPEGLRFYEPVTLNGSTATELLYDNVTDELRSASGDITLPSPTVAEHFAGTKGQWLFGYNRTSGPVADDMCSELADIISECTATTGASYGEQVREIYLGANMESAANDPHRMVLGWHTRFSGIDLYIGYAVEMTMADYQRQTVSIVPLEGANLFYNYSYWQPFVDFVCTGSPYQLSFDSNDNPKEVVLTSEKDSSKWFKLKLK